MQDFYGRKKTKAIIFHFKIPRPVCHNLGTYLVFVYLAILKFCFALLLKGDNYQSHEDIHEEKGKDDKKDDVEDRHLDTEQWYGALVFVSSGHRVLQHPVITNANNPMFICIRGKKK